MTPYDELDLVMICRLTVTDHYLNQYFLIISEACAIYPWAMPQGILKIPVRDMRFKITNLRQQQHLPVANESIFRAVHRWV